MKDLRVVDRKLSNILLIDNVKYTLINRLPTAIVSNRRTESQ